MIKNKIKINKDNIKEGMKKWEKYQETHHLQKLH